MANSLAPPEVSREARRRWQAYSATVLSSSTARKPQLASAGKYRVFKLHGGFGVDGGIHPAAWPLGLPEDRDFKAVGAQPSVEDVRGHAHPLVGSGGRGIPVGDDHAAKRIGGMQRHEGQRIERCVPKE